MKTILIGGENTLDFTVARASGEPGQPLSFVISSGGSTLTENIVLPNTGLFEYSLSPFTSWGQLSFNSGSIISETIVRVRLKPTTLTTIPSGTIPIGDASIPYTAQVDTSPKITVATTQQASLNLDCQIQSTITPDNQNLYVTSGSNEISATFSNFDLITGGVNFSVSDSTNAFGLSVNNVAFSGNHPVASSNSQSVTVSQSRQTYYFSVTRKRDASFNKKNTAYPWELKCSYSFNGAVEQIIQRGTYLMVLQDAEISGRPAPLNGECGLVCNPSSFRLKCKKVLNTDVYKIVAPQGFKVSLSKKAELSDLQTVLTLPITNNLTDVMLIYTYLDPFSNAGSKNGEVLITTANDILLNKVLVSGDNVATDLYALLTIKNIVYPNENPVKDIVFYFLNYEQNIIQKVNLVPSVTKYANSPFFKDTTNSEFSLIYSNQNDLTEYSTNVPSVPGDAEVQISWGQFTDPATGITFKAGNVVNSYFIFPNSEQSPVFFDVNKYLEFEKTNSFMDGYLFPNAQLYPNETVTAKNLNNQPITLDPNLLKICFSGLDYSGQQYDSDVPPTLPGNYTKKYFYLDSESLFERKNILGEAIDHGYSNGQILSNLQYEYPNNIYFTNSNYLNYTNQNWVVEVVNNRYFKIKTTGASPIYFKHAPGIDGTFFANVNGESSSFEASPGSSFTDRVFSQNSTLPPASFTYSTPYVISKRTIKYGFSADNVYPNNFVDPYSLRVRGVLSQDVGQISFTTPTNESIYFKDKNANTAIKVNEKQVEVSQDQYYNVNFQLVLDQSAKKDKYVYNLQLSGISTYYRKNVFAARPFLSNTKTYDGNSWIDSSPFSLSGLEPGETGSVRFTLSSFDASPYGTSPVIPGRNAKTHWAYPETEIVLFEKSQFYTISLDDYTIQQLFITKRELALTDSLQNYPSKQYDGTTLVAQTIPVNNVVSGDNVFIESLNLAIPSVGKFQATSGTLGGASKENYVLPQNILTGWNSTPNIEVNKKTLTLKLTATKQYDGINQYKIPLVTQLVGFSKRLPLEPVCITPLAPTFASSNAGPATSSDTRQFFGGNSANYDLGYDGQNTLTSNSISGNITQYPLTLRLNDFSINTDPIIFSNSKDVSQYIQNTLSINTLTNTPDTLEKADINFTALLNNQNRGDGRTISFTLLGIKETSQYKPNYIVTQATRTFGPITVLPKDISSEPEYLTIIDSGPETNRVWTKVPHNYSEGQIVLFKNIPPWINSISKAQAYFVRNPNLQSFQISTTNSGGIVEINDSTRKEITSVSSSGQAFINSNNHGFSIGQSIMFTSLSSSESGLSLRTKYFVKDATTNTFSVSINQGGAPITLSVSLVSGSFKKYSESIVFENTLAQQSLSFNGVLGQMLVSAEFSNQQPSIVFLPPETPTGTSQSFLEVRKITLNEDGEYQYGDAISNNDAKEAGLYEARFTFPGADDEDSQSNYKTEGYAKTVFEIKKRKLSINKVTVPRTVYGTGSWPSAQVQFSQTDVSGLISGHSSGINVSGQYVGSDPEVNSKVFTPVSKINLAWSVTDQVNYEIDNDKTISNTFGEVLKKGLSYATVEDPNTTSKVYDGLTLGPSGLKWGDNQPYPELSGILENDISEVLINQLTSTFGSKDCSQNVALKTSIVLSGDKSENYFVPQRTGVGSITPKPITFSGVRSGKKLFDGSKDAPIYKNNFSYIGLETTDIIKNTSLENTVVGNLYAYYTNFNAGENKTVYLSGILPPTPNYVLPTSPYELTPGEGDFAHTIEPRAVTIKPKTISRFYGELWPAGGLFVGPDYMLANQTAIPIVTGGTVLSIAVFNGGSGYTIAPTVTISPPAYTSGVQATATAVVSNGKITKINIAQKGRGYTLKPTLSLVGPGSGAIVSVNIDNNFKIQQEPQYEIYGLVESNEANGINPETGTYFGDEILSVSLLIDSSVLIKETEPGLYQKKTTAVASSVVFSKGLSSNYLINTGETEGNETLRGDSIIVSANFADLNLGIVDTIWAKKCKTFSCTELSWFDIINSPNQILQSVDLFDSTKDSLNIVAEPGAESLKTEG